MALKVDKKKVTMPCKSSKDSCSQDKTVEDGHCAFEDLDHSVLQQPLNLGVTNIKQILTCIQSGSREIKDIILNECNVIYECKVCVNLFRSLANFTYHKRCYCKKHMCEDMLLFEKFEEKEEEEEKVTVQPEAPKAKAKEPTLEVVKLTDCTVNLEKCDSFQVINSRASKDFKSTPSSSSNRKNAASGNNKAKIKEISENKKNGNPMVSRRTLNKSANIPIATSSACRIDELEDLSDSDMTPIKHTESKEIATNDTDNTVNRESRKTSMRKLGKPASSDSHNKTSKLANKKDSQQKTLNKVKPMKIKVPKLDTTADVHIPQFIFKTIKSNPNALFQSDDEKKLETFGISNKHEVTTVEVKLEDENVVVKKEIKTDSSSDSTPSESSKLNSELKKTTNCYLTRRKKLMTRTDCDVFDLKCLVCKTQFMSLKTLYYHMLSLHSKKRLYYPCPLCKTLFVQMYGVTRHLIDIHNKTKDEIYDLREIIKKKSVWKKVDDVSSSINKATSSINCPIANPSIEVKQEPSISESENIVSSTIAVKSSKSVTVHRCSKCNRAFGRKSSQVSHEKFCIMTLEVKLENDGSDISLPVQSGASVTSFPPLPKKPTPVIKASTRPKRDAEKQMDKDFVSSESLKWISVNSFDSNETDSSNKNDHSTKERTGMNLENKVHSSIMNPKNLSCLKCSKKFSSFSNLRKHMAIHVAWARSAAVQSSIPVSSFKSLPTKSPILSKQNSVIRYNKIQNNTVERSTIDYDMKMSIRPKRRAEKQMHKDFISSQSLKWRSANRIDTNTNKKLNRPKPPIAKFREKCSGKNLEDIVLSIMDTKDFVCLKCNKKFSSFHNLRRHAAIHVGWARYKCKCCNYQSYNKCECWSHVQKIHSVGENDIEKYIVNLVNTNTTRPYNKRYSCEEASSSKSKKSTKSPDKTLTHKPKKIPKMKISKKKIIENNFNKNCLQAEKVYLSEDESDDLDLEIVSSEEDTPLPHKKRTSHKKKLRVHKNHLPEEEESEYLDLETVESEEDAVLSNAKNTSHKKKLQTPKKYLEELEESEDFDLKINESEEDIVLTNAKNTTFHEKEMQIAKEYLQELEESDDRDIQIIESEETVLTTKNTSLKKKLQTPKKYLHKMEESETVDLKIIENEDDAVLTNAKNSSLKKKLRTPKKYLHELEESEDLHLEAIDSEEDTTLANAKSTSHKKKLYTQKRDFDELADLDLTLKSEKDSVITNTKKLRTEKKDVLEVEKSEDVEIIQSKDENKHQPAVSVQKIDQDSIPEPQKEKSRRIVYKIPNCRMIPIQKVPIPDYNSTANYKSVTSRSPTSIILSKKVPSSAVLSGVTTMPSQSIPTASSSSLISKSHKIEMKRPGDKIITTLLAQPGGSSKRTPIKIKIPVTANIVKELSKAPESCSETEAPIGDSLPKKDFSFKEGDVRRPSAPLIIGLVSAGTNAKLNIPEKKSP